MNLLAVILLLSANAFFVAAEFALVKVRSFRLDALDDEGRFGAALSKRMVMNLESYLAACQLGITMASLGLGWVGEPAVAAIIGPGLELLEFSPSSVHTLSFLIGFMTFSALHIVVGEQVPKTFAIRKPETISLAFAYPLHAFYLLMYPLNWLLNRASKGLLSLFGVEEAGHGDVLSGAELQNLVSLSHAQGAIEDKQAVMLSNLFEFDARTAGRVMIPRRDIVVLELNGDVKANRDAIANSGHSRLPVLDGETAVPVGILIVKEFYRALLCEGAAPWDSIMRFCRPPMVVPETMQISSLFETMRAQREHLTVVVDEYGEFVGIVALEDLIEEIVGDISDEHDDDEPNYPIEAMDGGGWIVHGLASLADVERTIGLKVPDDLDANTISGLFLCRLSRMPVVGDRIREGDFVLLVDEVTAHHVTRVKIMGFEAESQAASVENTDPLC